MKKYLKILTLITVIAIMLAGCSHSDPTPAKTETATEAATETATEETVHEETSEPTQAETLAPATEVEYIASDKEDLTEYLDMNIYEAINDFDNMRDVGATDGSIEYANEDIILSARPDERITFIILNSDKYCLQGIEVGMSLENAMGLMKAADAELNYDVPTLKHYIVDDKYDVGMYTVDDPDTVDCVNISYSD